MANGTVVLTFLSRSIASSVLPGQFLNIKTTDLCAPLLRRPFSVYRTEGDRVEIIFNVVGEGTRILAGKRNGDTIDVLGPLGLPYSTEANFDTAVLAGGGLGVAPLPVLTASLLSRRKKILTYLGARTADQIVKTHLLEVHVATDDGSEGLRGTVVDLLRSDLPRLRAGNVRIFGCGPNPMLKALGAMANEMGIPCEVSLESVMACGVGICQGCPVERTGLPKKYSLICKEGTVFDTRTILLA